MCSPVKVIKAVAEVFSAGPVPVEVVAVLRDPELDSFPVYRCRVSRTVGAWDRGMTWDSPMYALWDRARVKGCRTCWSGRKWYNRVSELPRFNRTWDRLGNEILRSE